MPVRNGAFDDIENYDKFPEPAESYQQLYAALKTMRENYTPVSEPRFEGYYGKVTALYDGSAPAAAGAARPRRQPAEDVGRLWQEETLGAARARICQIDGIRVLL